MVTGRGRVAVAVLAIVWLGATLSSQEQGPPGQGGFVAYPQRPAGDPAAIERGKALYGANCVFCHGADARGGDGGGPNLLRSAAVIEDKKGERISPIVREGRGAMPRFQLTDAQVGDIAEFLHGFPVSSRSGPSTIDIVVGDPKKGEAYVASKCSACHSTAAFKAFAMKIADAKMLQQMWLMPGNTGGRGGGPAPIAAPPVSVDVTLPSGEVVTGTLSRVDDFSVSLTAADGTHRTFRTVGTRIKVDIHDPLQPHKDLLPVYTDADIHNVTAYLISLRSQS